MIRCHGRTGWTSTMHLRLTQPESLLDPELATDTEAPATDADERSRSKRAGAAQTYSSWTTTRPGFMLVASRTGYLRIEGIHGGKRLLVPQSG